MGGGGGEKENHINILLDGRGEWESRERGLTFSEFRRGMGGGGRRRIILTFFKMVVENGSRWCQMT